MPKRSKKVGIVGKYGICYDDSLRKIVKMMETTQHSKYTCSFCDKDSMKRACVDISSCKRCKRVVAWVYSITAGVYVRSVVSRLLET